MKQKFGTIFFSILTIISLTVGLFFLRQEFIFSVIFFIGSLICGISAIQEYLYHKNRNILIDKTKVPDETHIKYSKSNNLTSILGYTVLIILGFYLLNIIGFDYKKFSRRDYFMLIVSGVLIFGYVWKTIKRVIQILSKKVYLLINNKGIALDGGSLMYWNEIRNEKIITRKEISDDSKYETEVKYISLFHKSKRMELKIDELDIPDYALEQYLKIYRDRFNQSNSKDTIKKSNIESQSVFENIMNIEELLSLSENELDKEIKNINALAKKYPQDLPKYCNNILDFKESNVSSIYFALSENSDSWGDFLANEFIRLFEKAKLNNDDKIYDILDEIICDYKSSYSPKVADYLYNQFKNPTDKVRLKALCYIDSWMDLENIQKSDYAVQKIVKMLKDDNWKVRWMANDILTAFKIFQKKEIEISFIDKIKAKYGNPYEIE